jgi:D-3-phosphoglycerate dehydrogenase
VFITGSGFARGAQQLLREQNCIFELGDPRDAPTDIAERVRRFKPDGLIVRQGIITAEVLDAAPQLKVICKHGVGTDNIDVAAASQRGIPVLFTPRANSESTAEHTLALILALLRSIPKEDQRIRTGVFDKRAYEGQELLGKTIGLIGFGRIGRRMAELLAPFRMNMLVYHPSRTRESLPANIVKLQHVEEMFPQADVISLHCPLTPETSGMIHARVIARMKPGAYLINTARGGLINEADLLLALREHRIAGAALDVFDAEPPAADHPFFRLDNVIVTPHVGGVSDKSLENMGMDAVENVLSVLRGQPVDEESFISKKVGNA